METIAVVVLAILFAVGVAAFLAAVIFPYEDNPRDDAVAKTIKLASATFVLGVAFVYFLAGVIFPYRGDPNNNQVPLFAPGETRVISSVVAVTCAAGAAWAVRRLKVHLSSK